LSLSHCLIPLYDIQGGFSALYDYSDQGNLEDHLPSLSKVDRLRVAVEISTALADLHSIDDPDLATVVHGVYVIILLSFTYFDANFYLYHLNFVSLAYDLDQPFHKK